MKKKIINPFNNLDNPCYGCSVHNDAGLKMEFWDNGEGLVSEWAPRPEFQGYVGILHGGIQATLLDEIASWTVYVKVGTAGVTYSMEVRYLRPVYLSRGPLHIVSRLVKREEKLAMIHTGLYDARQQLCTEAKIQYFLFPEHIAREKYYYPGKEAFYGKGRKE